MKTPSRLASILSAAWLAGTMLPGSLAAVLCDGDGMPLAIEVFEGNTLDPKTVSSQIQKIATRFGYITAITKP